MLYLTMDQRMWMPLLLFILPNMNHSNVSAIVDCIVFLSVDYSLLLVLFLLLGLSMLLWSIFTIIEASTVPVVVPFFRFVPSFPIYDQKPSGL